MSHEARTRAAPRADPELRIRLPLEYHLKLHELRLHAGRTLSHSIREALDLYFDRLIDEGALPSSRATSRQGSETQGTRHARSTHERRAEATSTS